MHTQAQNHDVVTLSRDEIVEQIDRESRRRLGLPAREMFLRYLSGNLDDTGAVSDLIILSELLPTDDPLFAAV